MLLEFSVSYMFQPEAYFPLCCITSSFKKHSEGIWELKGTDAVALKVNIFSGDADRHGLQRVPLSLQIMLQ